MILSEKVMMVIVSGECGGFVVVCESLSCLLEEMARKLGVV